jgi:hypothetical protein
VPTGKNLSFLKSFSVHGTCRERNCPFGFFVLLATLDKGGIFSMPEGVSTVGPPIAAEVLKLSVKRSPAVLSARDRTLTRWNIEENSTA